jgi:hypothetical protein
MNYPAFAIKMPDQKLQIMPRDETNPTKIQTSTCSTDSKRSDNRDMLNPHSRSAIACKLGTAIILLLHSLLGCSWTHACCDWQHMHSVHDSESHSGCHHVESSHRANSTAVSDACQHEPNEHQPQQVCSESKPCIEADPHHLAKELKTGIPSGVRRAIDHSPSSSPTVAHLTISLPTVTPAMRHLHQHKCVPPHEPCPDHSSTCCTTLHCSFIAATVKSSIIDLGSLFPETRTFFSRSEQSSSFAATMWPQNDFRLCQEARFRCALLCSWQV